MVIILSHLLCISLSGLRPNLVLGSGTQSCSMTLQIIFSCCASDPVLQHEFQSTLSSGHSPDVNVTETASGLHTATVQLPEGCPFTEPSQGPERPSAAVAGAAAARRCLQKLQGQGHLAGYWSSAALLQQAGVEGGWDGGYLGSDAVLWKCEVCGVPATSARNLEVNLFTHTVLQTWVHLACMAHPADRKRFLSNSTPNSSCRSYSCSPPHVFDVH